MVVFFILLLVPLVVQHVGVGQIIDYEKKNKRALAFFFIMLTVLVMLRHESVGNDTMNYRYYFNVFSNLSWDTVARDTMEPGFAYFNKLVSLVTSDPQVFLAIVAILTGVMIYPTYRRLCLDPSLTIVLLCTMSTFVMMFSGIRQMIAVAIGFIAYEFTRNKKLIFFILSVAFATLFHTSAFILIFMYPVYHARITQKWLFAVIPIIAIIFVFNESIFTTLALVLEQYTEYDTAISATGAYSMIILFAVFAVFAFLIPDEERLDKETIGLRNLLLLALVLQMFAPLHSLAMRMNYYFIIFIPLLLPKIISCRSSRWEQVAIWARHIMVVFFLGYFFFTAYTNIEGNLHVFPYHFFWESV